MTPILAKDTFYVRRTWITAAFLEDVDTLAARYDHGKTDGT